MLSYKIILDNNSTCFSSEVDYVSRYIERCYLVKRTNSDKADVIISYGKSMKCDSNIHLTPELMEFALSVNNNGISLVDKKPVIHALKKCMAKNNEKYTTSSTGVVCFKEDLIALSFILLSRIEERSSLELDQHERYSINNDIVFCAGLYGLLIVDSEVRSSYPLLSTCSTFYRSRDRIVMSEVTDSNINEVSNKIMLSYEVNKKKSINDFFDNTVVVDFISTYL